MLALRKRWPLLVAVIMFISASACGKSDSSPPSAKPTVPPESPAPSTTGRLGTVPTSTTMLPAEAELDAESVPEYDNLNFNFGQATINGVVYTNSLILKTSTSAGRVEINAGRTRKRFFGDLGIPDDQKSSSAYKVDISFDDAAPVFSADVRFGETKRIDLDVANVLRIRVSVSPATSISSATCCGEVAIGNPRFGR